MSIESSTAGMLRRISELEATVGRLIEDLGKRGTSVRIQRPLRLEPQLGRRRSADSIASTAGAPAASGTGGLAGAVARGEAARVQWVKDGLVVPGEELAQAWGLTRQALAPAAKRGELFTVKVGNRLYYPRPFIDLDREVVARICRALGRLGPSEMLMFWLREHGALAGRSVAKALETGIPLTAVERLALAWARERGAVRAAAAA